MPNRLPKSLRLPTSLSRGAQLEALAVTHGFQRIAGVDEAGRGPWAGPVVSAAVVLCASRLPVRIDDSKCLTSAQRARAFEVILERAEVGIGIACAEEIDRANILQATLGTMAQAIHDLPRPPDLVLVDGPMAPPIAIPCWPIIHGDATSRPIACASIVAKVIRDRLMTFYHRLYPHYQFHQHKGYGTSLHRAALRRWGVSLLHRRSVRPVAAFLAAHSAPGPLDRSASPLPVHPLPVIRPDEPTIPESALARAAQAAA